MQRKFGCTCVHLVSVLKSYKKQLSITLVRAALQDLSQNLNDVPRSLSIDGQMNSVPTCSLRQAL